MFLAIAFRLRTLLTSATFRPYSGADNVAPIVTQVFLSVKKKMFKQKIIQSFFPPSA